MRRKISGSNTLNNKEEDIKEIKVPIPPPIATETNQQRKGLFLFFKKDIKEQEKKLREKEKALEEKEKLLLKIEKELNDRKQKLNAQEEFIINRRNVLDNKEKA
ncbi:MAG: hypothetical protein QXG86_01790, partial [Candidatus Woesearchaeota archaeon]